MSLVKTICAAALMSAPAPVFGKQAENLIRNHGFERGFAEWREAGKAWRVEDGAGYGGSKGLVWECDGASGRGYPAQYVSIDAGSAYRLTALVKVDRLKGADRPAVGFEWFDVDGKWVAGAYATPVDDNGALKDGWERYEGTTGMMKSTDSRGGVLCMLKAGAVGKVRFDNITLERVPVKPVNFICTSAYRNAAADGDIRIIASVNASTNIHKAVLTVMTDTGEERTLVPVAFSEELAVFSVAVRELAVGRQTMTFSLLSGRDGEVVGSGLVGFERLGDDAPRRRVSFDSQRRMLLDGRKFFPLGHYTSAMSRKDMEQYRRGPYNFAIQYADITREQLDSWQKAGIVVASDVRKHVHGYYTATKRGIMTPDDTRRALRRLFGRIGSHPALVMWYLNDEAPVGMLPNTLTAHEALHEIDVERPTITCLCHPKTARDFLPSYDIIAHDCYPIGNEAGRSMPDRVTRQMREVEESMASMRPLWFIPQAFDWRWCYPEEKQAKCDRPYLRMPTRGEMANMTWQGVACGANGIVYYSYHVLRENTEGADFDKAWGDICDVAFEVKCMEDILLADDVTPEFVKGPAVLPKHLPVRFYRYGGRDWMLAVNATRERVRARLPLASRCRDFKTELGGGAVLLPDGKAIAFDFSPMEYTFVSFRNR